ncbi:MAG: hypothetical protein OSB47_12935 [Pirellulaceae bacterium]|nr:hypothetical protein [Pirellulaceae bacterium]
MAYNLYWGDLHSHCSVSYGHGSVDQALARANQQLDFASVTGHAFWPDMPTDREQYGTIIDYHNLGFSRLANNWDSLLTSQELHSRNGHFLALPSYEWHSLKYGDHNIYAAGPGLSLQDAATVSELRNLAIKQDAFAIPHHIGYAAGYRGINWDYYSEDRSPFVEIFSLHGCSLGDHSPYPMLHDMGPRDHGSTAVAGWDRGFHFGIVGGTDHHGAYPGSWGDGRMGVFAEALTPEALWEAFTERRVFAATGDRIDAHVTINDACLGSVISSKDARRISIQVAAADKLDRVDLYKNERLMQRFTPSIEAEEPMERRRLRVTWGWGAQDRLVDWLGQLSLNNARITAVESCFRGEAIVSPQPSSSLAEVPDNVDLPHEILESTEDSVSWKSVTRGNLTMRHATTQSLLLSIEGPLDARLALDVNDNRYLHQLGGLLNKGRCHYLRGWLSEAIQLGPLVPESACQFTTSFEDEPDQDEDRYRLEVTQSNGQCAWLTPIWVQR